MAGISATGTRYVFERRLGRGGAADVIQARDTLLRRRVALKSLHANEPEALAAEAQLLAGLRHPNIVQVFDLAQIVGEPYLVLEFVPGRSLDAVLAAGPLPASVAVGYTVEVARALAYAHAQGVIHNDVKPANILIDREGHARLTDFGVSRRVAETLAPGEAEEIAGSLPYLAPELVQGAEPGPGTDLYSLAATLYEMVTGTPPFAAPGAAGIAQRFAGPPPGLHETPGIWHGLAEFLERALSPNPVQRFADAATFADALAELPARHSWPAAVVQGPPARRPKRHAPRWLAGATAALIGAVLIGAAALALRESDRSTSGGEPPDTATPVAQGQAAADATAAAPTSASTVVPPTAVPPRAQDEAPAAGNKPKQAENKGNGKRKN